MKRLLSTLALLLATVPAWAGDFTSPGSRSMPKPACDNRGDALECIIKGASPSLKWNGNPQILSTFVPPLESNPTAFSPGLGLLYSGTDGTIALGSLWLTTKNSGAQGPILGIWKDDSAAAASDIVGSLVFAGSDSSGTDDFQVYSKLSGRIVDPNSLDERAALDIVVTGDNADVTYIFDDVGLTLPLNDNGGGPILNMNVASAQITLGTGGNIVFDSDVTLTDDTDEIDVTGGSINMASATTSYPSLRVPSGTVMTTAADGGIEADANTMYGTTDAGNRGYIPLRHVVYADGTNTLTSSVAEQALFTAANDTITLETGTYKFECYISLTAMSATSGNAAFDPLGAGTATVGSWMWHTQAVDGASAALATWQNSTIITQQTPASAATAGTATEMQFACDGTFEVTGAGTMIPSITLVTAAAAVVRIGSHFIFERIGGASPTSIGQWN